MAVDTHGFCASLSVWRWHIMHNTMRRSIYYSMSIDFMYEYCLVSMAVWCSCVSALYQHKQHSMEKCARAHPPEKWNPFKRKLLNWMAMVLMQTLNHTHTLMQTHSFYLQLKQTACMQPSLQLVCACRPYTIFRNCNQVYCTFNSITNLFDIPLT